MPFTIMQSGLNGIDRNRIFHVLLYIVSVRSSTPNFLFSSHIYFSCFRSQIAVGIGYALHRSVHPKECD